MSANWLALSSPVPRPSYVTSGYADDRDHRRHGGMDFRVAIGTPVFSVADGKVIRVVDRTGQDPAGKMIVIEHVGGLQSRYMHLSRFGVKQGQRVVAGQQIGWSGDTGANAPHLHFDLLLYPKDIAIWEAIFGRPAGGFILHSSGQYKMPVEPAIPIDGGKAEVWADAAALSLPTYAMIPRGGGSGAGWVVAGVLLVGGAATFALAMRHRARRAA